MNELTNNLTEGGPTIPLHLDTGNIMVNLVLGGIGMGLFIYGKKQKHAPTLFGGIAMMGCGYFIESALWLAVAGIAVGIGIFFWAKNE